MVENTDVVVPASTLKALADDCSDNIEHLKDSGHEYSAKRLANAVSDAYSVIGDDIEKDGEFVGFDSLKLSGLAAESVLEESDTARTFLEQYGYW